MKSKPILPSDTIYTHNKHLFKLNSTHPFFIKGIAFPTPPDSTPYDPSSWIAILHQLTSLKLQFNTIRLYRLDINEDYSEFFHEAARLGIYVLVPLTSASGAGVLDRKLAAPKCYRSKLFAYGVKAVRKYLQHPNVLAGLIGNEVMNDANAWKAAPCVRAYAADLKSYMESMLDSGVVERTLPLMYAGQDSATIGGAGVSKDEVMSLTLDYLSCIPGDGTDVSTGAVRSEYQSPIDIYGVNIESWCSSTQDFYTNPDGTPGTYYSLWMTLRNASIPIVFSEMGCPHSQFDRDDEERKTKEGTRDWAQIPIVLNDMAGSWSGFIAYTYDGPQDFTMFAGGPWDGKHILTPTKDFDNFQYQLNQVANVRPNVTFDNGYEFLPRHCGDVEADLLSCCDVRLFSNNKMPSYANMIDPKTGRPTNHNMWLTMAAFLIALGVTAWIHGRSKSKRNLMEGISLLSSHNGDGYKSFPR